jgi:hypothetical protein
MTNKELLASAGTRMPTWPELFLMGTLTRGEPQKDYAEHSRSVSTPNQEKEQPCDPMEDSA